MSTGRGIDIGTNSLVSAHIAEDGQTIFKQQRDAFFRILPKSDVNKNSIRISLDKRAANYVIDEDDSFLIIGQDALDIAIERNDVAQRPMQKGIISPKEKASLPMLKLIIESLVGKGGGSTKLFYSVPAKPIDGIFDITYHTEMMGLYLRQMGFDAKPINEAFAIALSELLDTGLTGISISFGAGLTNICISHEGDSLIEFSVARGGDFIDQSVGNALDISASLVQMEKEAGTNLYKPNTKIMEAVSVYYTSLLMYVFQNIAYELKRREKELPVFREPVPIILSGGLSLADGFVDKVKEVISTVDFIFKIGDIKLAESPMRAVASGCLLAANL